MSKDTRLALRLARSSDAPQLPGRNKESSRPLPPDRHGIEIEIAKAAYHIHRHQRTGA